MTEMMMYGATLQDLMNEAGISEEELIGDEQDSPEKILENTIQHFGFESPAVITIAKLIERGDVSVSTLRATLTGMM